MKQCVFGCNGSGLISLKDGSFVKCECLKRKKAELVFNRSASPKGSFRMVDDLEFNPFIQSMDVEAKIKEHLMKAKSQDETEAIKRKAFKQLKPVLEQYTKDSKFPKHYIEKNYRLFFQGDTGTGKTQSAIALACEGAGLGCEFYYLSFHKIHNLFRFNFSNEEKAKQVDEIKIAIDEAEILILDDMGKELDGLNLYVSEKDGDSPDLKLLKKIYGFLDGVIRDRKKLVIITSNLRKEEAMEIYKKYDPRIYSMLFDFKVKNYRFFENLRGKESTEENDDLF